MTHSVLREIDPEDNFINSYFSSLQIPQQSMYYSIQRFNETYSDDVNSFSICNYNIRSLMPIMIFLTLF